jgi:hypothetical protein
MEIIGSCGLVCSQCPAYIAYQTDDDALRKETAAEWSKMYGADIPAEAINCTGCRAEGVKIGHCAECAVRLCAIKKDVVNCAECAEYSCATLDKFIEPIPQASEKLEEMRREMKKRD